MITGLPDSDDDRELIDNAFKAWAPEADVELQPISPGYSGSSLFRVDVRNLKKGALKSGQYVLKLSRFSAWVEEDPEFDAHNLAYERDREFAASHIPKLIEYHTANEKREVGSGYAMLYEIAGGSFDRYAPTDGRQDGVFFGCAGDILLSLLEHWSDAETGPQQTAAELLLSLCEYRLDEKAAPALHRLAADLGKDLLFPFGEHVLVNPLKFFEFAKEKAFGRSSVLGGLIHGDLHGGNIMLNVMRPKNNPFYVIDFAMAKNGAVGYDAAYLELSHLLAALGDEDATVMLSALRAAEDPADPNPLPGAAHWSRDLVVQMREAARAWQQRHHRYRADEVDRQFALCRVAAGLNWANKPLPPARKFAALCYAGWAARQYLKTHEQKLWTELGATMQPQLKPATQEDGELWREIWETTQGFDATRAKFVLVAEGQPASDTLKAIGQMPWSAVIDLDPRSEDQGLYHHASPLLSARRGVHVFSSTIPIVDPRRGCGWMMAGGWAARSEYFPDRLAWRWDRLPIIRDFLRGVAEATSPEPLHVVVLPGATLDVSEPSARLNNIVAAIDEVSRGRAKIHWLGHQPVGEIAQQLSVLPFEPALFVERAAAAFGTGFSARVAEVPGPNREGRAIPVELLRSMQENLHVLHSTILDDQNETSDADAEFWRGRPPTWAELQAGLDIERAIHPELLRVLRDRLEAHRNQTVVLEHSPGAGGTTAALRAAWDLRSQYPVAVLHRHSKALADRVRELCQLSEQPVLLVAEASVLTESAREELYRYLAQNNCRVVFLYLRRTLAKSSVGETNIVGHMNKPEAGRFLTAYSRLSEDRERKQQLKQITERDALEQYRVPFFYGLVTYEDDFLGIEGYVTNHLGKLQRDVRDILEHLALVTIYSNTGLSIALIKALMDVDADSPLTLADLLGEGPARLLVVRSGGVRFMHWMIADRVMSHFRGGLDDEWRLDLKAYATSFIRRSVMAAGPEAMRPLFRQMFIDRVGVSEEVDDREDFAPIVETLDAIDKTLGQAVLEVLAQECPQDSHFWAHLGRHQVYRMARDFEKAEEYLRRAISIAPDDALHHHTFGMVLRSQLRHRLQGLGQTSDVAQIFAELSSTFDLASEEFGETRRLSPDNVYGYITHIQMIIMASRRLKRAEGADSIARVARGRPEIEAWITENLSTAEDLLRNATNLYATLDRSDEYLTRCEADLDELYGDLDSVVEIWEIANAGGIGSPRRRRALANAYLTRRDRNWSQLREPELRRVVELMEQNLRDPGRRDDDYELWFSAYMLLPDFDADEALSQLALWATRFPSWRAHYYAYVLNFLLWFEQRTDDLNAFDTSLEESRKRHVGRRNYSPVWYGESAGNSGLVAESDLGGWSKDLNFFANPSALRTINGHIEQITGPQAGRILIAGRVSVFFVPGKTFSAHRNENDAVHFYLGFSPTGLRAWSVKPGRDDSVERSAPEREPAGATAVRVPTVRASKAEKKARATTLRRDRAERFLRDLVAAKIRVGATVSQIDLEQHLDAFIGEAKAAAFLKVESVLQDLIRDAQRNGESGSAPVAGTNDDLHQEAEHNDGPVADGRLFGKVTFFESKKAFGFIEGSDGETYWFHRDHVLPRFKTAVNDKGLLVRFLPTENGDNLQAHGVVLVKQRTWARGKLLTDAEVAPAVAAFVQSRLEEVGSAPVKTLVQEIAEAFWASEPIATKLEAKDIAGFIAGLDFLSITRTKAGIWARLLDSEISGPPKTLHILAKSAGPAPRGVAPKHVEQPASEKQASRLAARAIAESEADGGKTPTVEDVRAFVCSALDEARRPIAMAGIGNLLLVRFPGEEKVHRRLGFARFTALIEALDGIEIGPEPDHLVSRST